MGTVRNAIQRYEVVLIGTLAASSAKTYMSRLRFAADRLPDSLSAVQLWHLEAVVATYRETRQPNTVALFVTVVKSFFAWCVDVELLKKDPALRLKAPKRTKWQPRALSAAAIDALLESIHTTTDSQDWRQVRNETIVRVMLFAGLRRAEVVQLMWIERGASLDEVRDLLGHESLATTQVYVATSPERLRAAIERLTE